MSTETTPETTSAPVEAAPEQAQLDQLRADAEKFKDLAMRSAAELENYRKRAAREKDDAVKYANAAFLERLVPILDNFELGLSAAKGDSAASAIVAGLEMVGRQLQDFLTACGVEPVNADPGTPFDPNVHEAIGQQEHPEIPDGAVIQQMRKGFKLRDRLLRPATVLVSKGPQAAS